MKFSNVFYYTCLSILVLNFALFTSCKDDGSDDENGGERPFGITAVVEAGSNYNSKIDSVKMETANENTQDLAIIASTAYLNGSFNFTLPYPLDGKYLINNILSEDELPSGVTVSDKTAKAITTSCNGYKKGVKVDEAYFTYGGYVTNISSTTLKIEMTQVNIVYCDKPVKVSGSYTEVIDDINAHSTIDVSWLKGWNTTYITQKIIVNLQNGTRTLDEVVTLNKPSYSLKWYYGDDLEESLSSVLGLSSVVGPINNKMKTSFFQLKK